MVAVTVTVSFRDVSTATFVDSTRTITYATLVVRTYTVVNVVTNAISVSVSRTVTATYA